MLYWGIINKKNIYALIGHTAFNRFAINKRYIYEFQKFT